MIGMLVGWGMSEKAAKIVAYVAIPLLILAAFYIALDAYGDSRYDAGKAQADAEWKAASDKLVQKAQDAGTKADKAAAGRAADYAAKVEDEKERIDAAKEDGSSPMDVLFGAGS
jgi:hypothetical protein